VGRKSFPDDVRKASTLLVEVTKNFLPMEAFQKKTGKEVVKSHTSDIREKRLFDRTVRNGDIGLDHLEAFSSLW